MALEGRGWTQAGSGPVCEQRGSRSGTEREVFGSAALPPGERGGFWRRGGGAPTGTRLCPERARDVREAAGSASGVLCRSLSVSVCIAEVPNVCPARSRRAKGSGTQTAEDKTRSCVRKGRQEPPCRRPVRGQACPAGPLAAFNPKRKDGAAQKQGWVHGDGDVGSDRGPPGARGSDRDQQPRLRSSSGRVPAPGPGWTVGSRVSADGDPGVGARTPKSRNPDGGRALASARTAPASRTRGLRPLLLLCKERRPPEWVGLLQAPCCHRWERRLPFTVPDAGF